LIYTTVNKVVFFDIVSVKTAIEKELILISCLQVLIVLDFFEKDDDLYYKILEKLSYVS